MQAKSFVGALAPAALIEKCRNSRVWVLLKGEREVEGTLLGFDVFLNLVLGDVVDYCVTEKGTVATRMGDILLNGNNVAVIVPGGRPEDSDQRHLNGTHPGE